RGDIVTEIIFGNIAREDPIGQLGLSRDAALRNNGITYGPTVQDPALKFQNQGLGLIDLEKYVLCIGPRSGTELEGDTVKIDRLYLKVIIATGKKQPGTKHQKESPSHASNLRQFNFNPRMGRFTLKEINFISCNFDLLKSKSSMQKVYLDNAATTQVREEVITRMQQALAHHYGNPSSTHSFGRTAKTMVEQARKTIAKILNAQASEIIFTSGGTEGNNMILRSVVKDLGVTTLITSKIEHHAVLHTVEDLEREYGIAVRYVEL